jgi:2-methylfumaryl-CoA isomerase
MVLALTGRQWSSLCTATGMDFPSEFAREEVRFENRRAVWAHLERWVAERDLAEVRALFDKGSVLWGPYQDFQQLVREDPRLGPGNPVFAEVEQPGVGRWPMPGSPADFSAVPRLPVRPAPAMGGDTEPVLEDLLALTAGDLAALRAQKVIE